MIAGTIRVLLEEGHSAEAALAGVGRRPLSRSQLREHVGQTVAALNGRGIGRNDRVAIVLHNGPELAAAFLGIACAATAAPLNPAYRPDDFRFYLTDLGAKALVVERGVQSAAIGVAQELKIPVLEVESNQEDPAGMFSLRGDPVGPARNDGMAGADDVALILHTSGTTARPKVVPLSQRNLAASAHHIVETLRLGPGDRGLSIMPLFHIHGLVASVLAPLAAGGAVFCAPPLDPLRFFLWMSEAVPTWYTAVPTMHQAILAHAAENRAIIEQVRLRFIRSSSAPLPPAVMRRLEETFQAPVIESYGMTEAAHQMASNPLPPAARKAGTVGVAAGPEIAIMDAGGGLLPAGATGEVVIRGPNVMAGYGGDPDSNAQAFTSGWFRTGDQGALDADGYLTITGRLKEIINRGGEKISPREVDDAIMEHPDVAGAATFPIPHPTLGEEIGAVVVARRGATLTEQALLEFLSGRVMAFKIPRRFVLADQIPKSPTGKVQRHGLAAALGLAGGAERAAKDMDERQPTPLEAQLRRLWAMVLGSDRAIGLNDNFFLLGGDSLHAVALLVAVKKELGRSLPLSVMIEAGTIVGMASRIERDTALRCVVPIRTGGTRPPFYCIHGLNGQVLNGQNLARHLGDEQPFYGIQSVGLDGKRPPLSRIEDMAAHYIAEMRENQPRGPYHFGGYSMGGWVAYEMARQLHAQGERVGLLALIDPFFVDERSRATFRQWVQRRWAEFSRLPMTEKSEFLLQRVLNAPGMVAQHLRRKWTAQKHVTATDVAAEDENQQRVVDANYLAVRTYRPRVEPFDGDAVQFTANLAAWDDPAMQDGWRTVILGRLQRRALDVPHAHMLDEPFVGKLALVLGECLAKSSTGQVQAARQGSAVTAAQLS